MTIVHVQQAMSAAGSATAAASVAVTLGGAVGSGNLVCGVVTFHATNTTALANVTDNKGNVYTFYTVQHAANLQCTALYWANNIVNAPTIVTANFSPASSFLRIAADEYSGIDTTVGALDGHLLSDSTPGTGTDAVTSGAITTTADGDLLYAATQDTNATGSQTIAAGTNFVKRNDGGASAATAIVTEDQVQATRGAVSGTFTISLAGHAMGTGVLAFKAAAGGPALIVHQQQALAAPNTAAATTVAIAFPAIVGVGNLVVGLVTWDSTNAPTLAIADNKGNVYTVYQANDATDKQGSAMFWRNNITNAPQTVTATFSVAAAFRRIAVDEYSNIDTTAGALDGHLIIDQPSAGIATNAATSGTITTTAAGDLIYGVALNTNGTTATIAAGTNFTKRNDGTGAVPTRMITEDFIQVASGAVAATATVAAISHMAVGVMAFKAAGTVIGPGFIQGDTLCVAVDYNAKRIWCRTNSGLWNNAVAGLQDPGTTTGGYDISTIMGGSGGAFPAWGYETIGDQVTANFGATAFAQPLPTGFGAINQAPIAPTPTPSPSPIPSGSGPASGLTGWVIDREYTFGPSGTIQTIAQLQALFGYTLPFGTVNQEWQAYTNFNPANIAIVGNELHLIATNTRGIGVGLIDSAEIVSNLPITAGGPTIIEWNLKAADGVGTASGGWLYPAALPDGTQGPTNQSEVDGVLIVDSATDTTTGVYLQPAVGGGGAVTTQTGSLLDANNRYAPGADFGAGFHTFGVHWDGTLEEHWVDTVRVVSRNRTWTSGNPRLVMSLVCGWGSAAVLAAGFYVSPSGSDSNAGTLAAPFLTLEKARTAMQGTGAAKVTYLRGGTYSRTATLSLGSADTGTTWQYYPPDGYNSAILDCGGVAGRNGIVINGGSTITINGLQTQNTDLYGIGLHGGSSEANGTNTSEPEFTLTGTASGNTVTNCIIHDVKNSSNHYANCAGIMAFGTLPNLTITNNVVYNTPVMGIKTGGKTNGDLNNLLIANNFVHDCCGQQTNGNHGDMGPIYIQTFNNGAPAFSTNMRVTNNFIRDWQGGRAIYLDNDTSAVTVTGNVIGPPTPTSVFWSNVVGSPAAMFNDSAYNCTFSGNIIDLGSTAHYYVVAFSDFPNNVKCSNDPFTGNIIIANYAGANAATTAWTGGTIGGAYIGNGSGAEVIKNNMYHNYGGGAEDTNAFGVGNGDTAPLHADPLLSGWTYTLASNSTAFQAPVNFQPIIGGWGPPGYIIPQTGTAPSCPHP